MYCPQCNSEYREGFTACAECQVPLVEGSPEKMEESEEEEGGLRVLLETTHPTSLDSIIISLEQHGVPYIVQSGTALSLLEGLLSENLPEDWKAIVMVPAEHLETARRLEAAESKQEPAQEEEEP